MVAELRDKETPQNILFFETIRDCFQSAINTMYYNTIILLYQIALHPGAKVKRLFGNIIFRFTGYHTTAAPDALVDLDSHRETFFEAGILG